MTIHIGLPRGQHRRIGNWNMRTAKYGMVFTGNRRKWTQKIPNNSKALGTTSQLFPDGDSCSPSNSRYVMTHPPYIQLAMKQVTWWVICVYSDYTCMVCLRFLISRAAGQPNAHEYHHHPRLRINKTGFSHHITSHPRFNPQSWPSKCRIVGLCWVLYLQHPLVSFSHSDGTSPFASSANHHLFIIYFSGPMESRGFH